MSIMTNGRAPSKARPAPVRTTTVIFDSGRREVVCRFGRGVLPSRVHYHAPFTAQDIAEAAQMFGDATADANAEWDAESDESYDQRALEAAMLERYTRGHVI